MAKENKPWPDYPPVLRERAIIQRGLQFYFSCAVCKQLGWDKACPGEGNCGTYLYKKLEEHCKEWARVKSSTAGSVRH